MKRSCKDIDITDTETVYPWVLDCILRHKKRHDFRDMVIHIGKMSRRKYYDALHGHDTAAFARAAYNIAAEAARRIALRFLRCRQLNIRQARRIASYKGYFKHSDSKKIIKKLRLTDLFAAAAHAVGRYDGRMNNDKNYVWLPT